jgi:phosphoribosyl-AMP cyclohydrolase
MPPDLENLKYDAAGLIPAIIQDADNGQVLMMAWMNRASLAVETGFTHFWSRSRQKFWKKGESSGHVQQVVSLSTDCDRDVLLIQVRQTGAACHDGYRTCFYSRLEPDGRWIVVGEPMVNPESVYGKS